LFPEHSTNQQYIPQEYTAKQYWGDNACRAIVFACDITFDCETGYQKNADGTACEPMQFSAEYDCNTGNGDKTVEVTYNTVFAPETDICTRRYYTFIGWKLDDTDANDPFTWTYTENRKLVAQWKRNTATCDAGTYLPADSEECVECIKNSYCAGGTFEIKDEHQGIEYCPYGLTSPAGSTNVTQCTAEPKSCVIDFATQAHHYWDYDKNAYGKCIVEECEFGYHIEVNACVLDEMPCETLNGTGIKIWNTELNKYDECIATVCEPGYINEDNQCKPCDNMYDANGEPAVSTYVAECEIAACLYQGEKYTLENNECVPICESESDETGRRYWNGTKCVHECEDGYTTW
jgi:uncharacterized repeat protein (TIGR02543 family)